MYMSIFINLTKERSPQHKHKDYEIIVCTDGEGFFHFTKKNIDCCSGKIIVIPPETAHSCETTCLNRIFIRGEFNQIFNLTSPVVISDNSAGEGLLLAKMIYANRYADREYIAALVNAFTHFLLQNIKMEDEIFLSIQEITENISNDFYNCNINLNALLKKSGYAEDYIRAQFKRIMGKTPTEFLTEVRINHACYLIDIYKNSFSLADVAEKCGYTDYVYFSRRFKQVTGISPRKYMLGE